MSPCLGSKWVTLLQSEPFPVLKPNDLGAWTPIELLYNLLTLRESSETLLCVFGPEPKHKSQNLHRKIPSEPWKTPQLEPAYIVYTLARNLGQLNRMAT